jgi:hypothetical protein
VVRYVPDRTGRFFDRPHYQPKEIDHICEQMLAEYYRKKKRQLELPITTDDLTLMIEEDVSDFDGFADLSRFGSSVEGLTEFVPKKKPRVRIAAALAEDGRRENRYRTTLTHEWGHVRLHAYLFEMDRPVRTLDGTPGRDDRMQICKRDTIVSAAQSDWMEWQAGHVCGAVLMPGSALRVMIGEFQQTRGIYGPIDATGEHGRDLISLIVTRCQVSAEAARVRLSRLGYLGTEQGPSLFNI